MTEIFLMDSAPHGEVTGAPHGFTGPLPAVIRKRWDDGDLRRVTEDGAPWPGGDYLPDDAEAVAAPVAAPAPVIAEPEPAADDPASSDFSEPQRPRGNASQEAWAAYAVALGALSEDEASGMSRDEIVSAVSPAAG